MLCGKEQTPHSKSKLPSHFVFDKLIGNTPERQPENVGSKLINTTLSTHKKLFNYSSSVNSTDRTDEGKSAII